MNIYMSNPNVYRYSTKVNEVEYGDDYVAIVPAENIVRGGGGGQPRDRGEVFFEQTSAIIQDVFKKDGKTWLKLHRDVPKLALEGPIDLSVDEAYRNELAKSHTLTHVAMACLKTVLVGFRSMGAEISKEGHSSELFFAASEPVIEELVNQAEILARYGIGKSLPVHSQNVKIGKEINAVEIVAAQFPHWRVNPDSQFKSGRLRIVHIDGLDSNPCGGSHVSNTSEIGSFLFDNLREVEGGMALSAVRTSTWQKWFGEQALLQCNRVNREALAF